MGENLEVGICHAGDSDPIDLKEPAVRLLEGAQILHLWPCSSSDARSLGPPALAHILSIVSEMIWAAFLFPNPFRLHQDLSSGKLGNKTKLRILAKPRANNKKGVSMKSTVLCTSNLGSALSDSRTRCVEFRGGHYLSHAADLFCTCAAALGTFRKSLGPGHSEAPGGASQSCGLGTSAQGPRNTASGGPHQAIVLPRKGPNMFDSDLRR